MDFKKNTYKGVVQRGAERGKALGFPTDGDRADDPAYDDVIQSECGLADAYRRAQGSPQLCPTILADKVCGMAIANAVVIGVLHKYRTGRGQLQCPF